MSSGIIEKASAKAVDKDMDENERKVQELLSRRRAFNCSGQTGEDIDLIRAAFANANRSTT